MSKRDYELGKRADQMAETRQRILDAAHDLFTEEGFPRVSVSAIAERASVTRATVYNHFESKTGVLSALMDELDRRAEIERLAEAVDQPDPAQALRDFLREHCRFWAADVEVLRNVFHTASFDVELQDAVTRQERKRKAAIAGLVRRIDRVGQLHPDWTQARATNAVWMLTHFETFDFLYRREDMDIEQVADVLAPLAESMLSEPGE